MSVRLSRSARLFLLSIAVFGGLGVYVVDRASGGDVVNSPIRVVSTAVGDGNMTDRPALALPQPASAGDLLLVAANPPVGVGVAPPAGFALVADVAGTTNGEPRLVVWSKIAQGGEVEARYELPNWARVRNLGVLVAYRGALATSPIEAKASVLRGWGYASDAPSVSTTSASGRVVVFTQSRGADTAHTFTSPAVALTGSCCQAISVAERPAGGGDSGPTTVGFTQPSRTAHVVLALRGAADDTAASTTPVPAIPQGPSAPHTNVGPASTTPAAVISVPPPATTAPTSTAPATSAPATTSAPVTVAPTTVAPTTAAPTTAATTAPATTSPATTVAPTTAPSIGAPASAKPTDSSTGPRIALSTLGAGYLSGSYRGVRITGNITTSGPLTLTDCWIDGNITVFDNPITLDHCYVNGYVGLLTNNTDPNRSMFTARFTRFIGPADDDVMHLGARVWGDNSRYLNTLIEDSIIYSPYAPQPGAHADVLQFGGGRNSTFRRVVFSLRQQAFDSSLTNYINNGTQNPGVTFESLWVEGGPMGYTLGGPMSISTCTLARSAAQYGFVYPDGDGNTGNDPKLMNCYDDAGILLR